MIIKHKGTYKQLNTLSPLVRKVTWSGNRQQVARKLIFDYAQDPRDPNLQNYIINVGETVFGYDEDGGLQFQGNVYAIEKDVQASHTVITAYDNLFVLSKSKTTHNYHEITPEAITKSICEELGVKVGNIAATNTSVSFVASRKTGYQIIMAAYTEACKTLNKGLKDDDPKKKLYHPVMNGDALDVILKGTLIEGFEAHDLANITHSSYKESIEHIVNQVLVTDDKGNMTSISRDDDSIKKYSMFQDVYKQNPNDNVQEQIDALMKKPERTGTMELLGDYKVKSSYSIKVTESLFPAKFWIKSDTHTFEHGVHTMHIEAEFENLMNEEKAEKEKTKNGG